MHLIQREKPTKRGRIGDPIDPDYLVVAGQIEPGAPVSKRARPARIGEGSETYRLYCTQGIWTRDCQMGLLSLQALPGKAEGEEEIQILQVSVDGGSSRGNSFGPGQAVFRLQGSMSCRNDQPYRWNLASALYNYSDDPKGPVIADTQLRESFEIVGDQLRVTANGRSFQRPLPGPSWFSEWNLLRMVGRLPLGEDPGLSFSFLEGLTVSKGQARLLNTSRNSAPAFGGDLYSFSMLARGIVPYDFWMDENQNLVACVTGGLGRAYIPEALMIPPIQDFVATEFTKEREV